MRISEQQYGRVMVVFLKGSLMGEPDTTALRKTMSRLAERSQDQIVLDLGGLKSINSTGLGELIAALLSLRKRNRDLCLARMTPKVNVLMATTHLIKVFRIFETLERAVASFAR
jgi:anti-sigma B factor antagonist